MKKESNYNITFNGRSPLTYVPINDRIVASGDIRQRSSIVRETNDIIRTIRSGTSIPESDLELFRNWSRHSGIPITITRIKRKYTRRTPVTTETVEVDVIEPIVIKVPGVFNIGDEVIIINNTTGSINQIGEIGIIITDFNSTNQCQVQVGARKSNSTWTRHTDIEHYDKDKYAPKLDEDPLFGCFVPINTLFNVDPRFPANDSTTYTVVSINKFSVGIRQKKYPGSNLSIYTIAKFNEILHCRQWEVINPTSEITERIGVFNNIVKVEDFKDGAAEKTEGKFLKYVETKIIEIKKAGSIVYIPISPGFTGNCQLSIIGSMSSLMSYSSDPRTQLKEITKLTGRKLLLSDVRSEVYKQMQEKLPKEAFRSVSPYNSTNGSNMIICILDITKL